MVHPLSPGSPSPPPPSPPPPGTPSPALYRRMTSWIAQHLKTIFAWSTAGAIVLYVLNGLYSGNWVPGLASLQHVGVVRLRYAITAPKDLKLNESGNVSVAGYYIDGSPEPADSLECIAEGKPLINGLSLSRDCAHLASIVNDESNFTKGGAPISLNLTLNIRRSYDWRSTIETVTITLLDQAQPIIRSDAPQEDRDISVVIGNTAHFRADFEIGKLPSGIHCQWYQEDSALNPFSPSTGCDGVTYAAPKTAVATEPKPVKIGVNVTDAFDHAIGKAEATIHLHLPRANFTTLVVDTSARMNGPEFNAATSRINSEIDNLNYTEGWLSLTGFGGDPERNVACSPSGVHQVYQLAPFNPADAQAAAKQIVLGPSKWAPLKLAIELAARQFAQQLVVDRVKYPDNLFYFIILTGGGDTCSSAPLEGIFQNIHGAMTRTAAGSIYFDTELLTAVIATSLSADETRRIRHNKAYTQDNRSVLFAPRTTDDLINILDDLAVLSNLQQRQSARIQACNDLVRQVSEDEHASGWNLTLGALV